MTCPICNDTGETGAYGVLDCPNCQATSERHALNVVIEALPFMTPYDLQWQAYQMGRSIVERELVDMLRSMWGHAIDLGETDYFAESKESRLDWTADCVAAAKMIAKYSKT